MYFNVEPTFLSNKRIQELLSEQLTHNFLYIYSLHENLAHDHLVGVDHHLEDIMNDFMCLM